MKQRCIAMFLNKYVNIDNTARRTLHKNKHSNTNKNYNEKHRHTDFFISPENQWHN